MRFRLVALLLVVSLLTLAVPTQFIRIFPTAHAAPSTSIVISEFRFRGPSGGNDEFVELLNVSSSTIIIGGWKLKGSNNAAGTSVRATIPALTALGPGCRYLFTNNASAGYSGAVTGNLTYGTGIGDDGGIAITKADDTIVDQVGLSAGSAYKEGTTLPNLGTTTAANLNRGYERKLNGAQDTDNNNNDFQLKNPSDPQNAAAGCLMTATNPSATTAASPASVSAGDSTLLTVSVTPGANPTSTGIAVSANLSSIGGQSAQQFFDDATNGDAVAGDNVFSYTASIPNGTGGGSKSFTVLVSDAQGRSTTPNPTIALTVLAPTAITATGAASPSSLQVGQSSLLTVTVTPGTNPASAGITVTCNLSSIGGQSAQQFFDDATNGDAVAGDNVFSFNATVGGATSLGAKTLPVTVADNYPRTANPNITLTVKAPPAAPGSVVISQVYGGGGNNNATLKNDFIELFNRGTTAINLSGWSVQYASAGGGAGATWTRKTNLTGVINPGQYFLIQEAAGAGGTADLPTPDLTASDATGIIPMGASDGKVALVSDTDFLPNGCPVGNPYVVDFVGYGSADCREGDAAAPALSNTTAAIRLRNGCKDTDYNSLNFTEDAPAPRNSSTTPNTCPATDLAPEVIKTNPANAGTNIPVASNITVAFDASVGVADGGITVSCATSGPHTVAVTGGPTSFTVNPDDDFLPGEQCTVTVLASHVSSLSSPPVPMAADYAWAFGTLIVRDPSEHLVMGNPSGAVADEGTPLNYLMTKTQYALSYNNERGIPNWTSWHLDSTWTTDIADRTNDFRPDDTLPASFKHVTNGYNFATYGFDRGHMTPSADRTSSVEDNRATFLMTNMVPQASGNNQGPWARMEGDLRSLLGGASKELYIISGGQGTGGTSTEGQFDSILDTGGNSVAVPHVTWKVVMILPRADGDDVARVNTATRTFAVIMPNNDNIRPDDWRKYIATVDQVEALTGYNFFSNVPEAIQNVIEAQLDSEYDTAPAAAGQSVTTAEDTAKAVTLSATDFNVNNAFTYTVVSQPSNGQLSGAGNSLTYTPFADYSGPDSFTFKVNDGSKDSNTATVSINVTAVNDAPAADDDTFGTSEDAPAADVNVLGNDTDVENDALAVTNVGAASHGTATLAGGVVKYAPAANYNGSDSFTYTVSDGHGGTATATVSITVTAVNDNPTTTNDSATTDEDTPVSVDVVFNDNDVDGDTLSLESADGATHGSVAVDNGKAVFTPAANYHGSASFDYVVSDGHGGTATGSVNVTVNPVNDGPVAGADEATTNEDASVTVNVLANDSDVDGDTLSVTNAGGATKGSVSVSAGGVTYTPNANANGTDSFTYTVSDGHGGTATATVSVTVNAVNDAPSISNVPATATTAELAAYTFTASAADVDGDGLTFSLVGGPAGASINPSTGEFSWTPAEAQGGTGTPFNFTVRVSDGTLNADSSVSITVTEVNQAPTLAPVGNKVVLLGGALTFTASGSDADVPTQTLTYSLTGAFPAGASINPTTGVFNWTPTAAQAGQTYTFGVRVTDNGVGQLHADEAIVVGAGYTWSGFLQPVNQDGSSIFKLGQTVPVKFQLTGASAGVTNAVARLYVAKVTDQVVGTEEEADSTSNATEGNLFRYADGQYVFNLSTAGLTAGTYQLRVDTGDGVMRVVNISLR